MLGVGEQFPSFSLTAAVSLEEAEPFKTIWLKPAAGLRQPQACRIICNTVLPATRGESRPLTVAASQRSDSTEPRVWASVHS
jgi:hypothetical protein